MACHPSSDESLNDLTRLQQQCESRGDHCLSLLLSGVSLYVRLGRELELLEMMRDHAVDMRESVEGTPSAEQLRRLFEADDGAAS